MSAQLLKGQTSPISIRVDGAALAGLQRTSAQRRACPVLGNLAGPFARRYLQDMAKAAGERIYFESLELAIASWGKWSGESWRTREARQALDALIEIKGRPSIGSGAGRSPAGATPYYMPAFSKQYVSVTWAGEMGLQLQRGFMQATVQLSPLWVADDRAIPESQQGKWFVRAFHDHLEFGKASEKGSARVAECANGCSPGEKQPIGSECQYCEEPIAAPRS